jgi:nucleotidyltransferase/DNA polymerase involved in DNA repair
MFAVLFIADFALHAVLRTESAPADRPAALFAGAGKKSVVLAATPAARAAGVEPGMTAPQAVARCPTLVIRSPLPAAEAEARAALLAVGFTLGPLIEDTAPGVCTIDLKGATARPEPVAAAAIRQLAALGLPATAGLARTPLLARYAAEVEQRAPAPLFVAETDPLVADPALKQPGDRLLHLDQNVPRTPSVMPVPIAWKPVTTAGLVPLFCMLSSGASKTFLREKNRFTRSEIR